MKRYDLHPTRRRLLSGLAGLAALPTVAAAGPVLSSACPPRSVAPPRRRARGLPPTPELAVSLRALSQRLTARGQDRDQARALFGLTSVDGVMLAEDDPNTVFPLQRLQDLAGAGTIGAVADHAVTFMGGIYSHRRSREQLAPAVVRSAKSTHVDLVLLVPV